MTQARSSRSLVIGVIAASMIAAAAVTSIAVPAAVRFALPAPVIATVDLSKVLDQLDERKGAEAGLKAFQEDLQGQLNKLADDLKNSEMKINSAPDVAAKKAAAAKLIEMRANAKVKKELFEALIDQKRGETYKDLYEKMTAAAGRLAKQSAYTMVIVSDEGVKVPDGPSQEIERTISLKRFMYIDSRHDITAELVTLMNNEFKAAPAPAANK